MPWSLYTDPVAGAATSCALVVSGDSSKGFLETKGAETVSLVLVYAKEAVSCAEVTVEATVWLTESYLRAEEEGKIMFSHFKKTQARARRCFLYILQPRSRERDAAIVDCVLPMVDLTVPTVLVTVSLVESTVETTVSLVEQYLFEIASAVWSYVFLVAVA